MFRTEISYWNLMAKLKTQTVKNAQANENCS